jgi:hypothetical protein
VTAIKRLDKRSEDLFTHSPKTTKAATRILLSLSASFGTDLSTRDVSQALVSSRYELLREVWVVPPKEAGRHPDALWLLKRPLYWLPESGQLWFETYLGHNVSKQGMTATPFDPCLLYRHRRDKANFVGIISGNKEYAGHKPTTDVLPDAYDQVFDPSQRLDGFLCLKVDYTIETGSEQFMADEDKH